MTENAMYETRAQAETVLALARSMLAAAEAELWSEVARIEPLWSDAIRGLFEQGPRGEAESRFVASVLSTVKNIQDLVVEKVVAERERAAQELRRIREGRQIEKTYRVAEEVEA